MKLILFLLSFLFIFSTNVSAHVLNPPTSQLPGEHIKSFDSEISIKLDGTISVKETIIYDFSTLNKHGIFRNIPFTKLDENDKRVDLKFEDFSVVDETGNPYNFEKSIENEQIILKIGDANKTISGKHTYIISYRVSGALGYFKDHDELFWNVTGNGWEIPIEASSTHIVLPDEIKKEQIQTLCFTGSYGSKDKRCTTTNEGATLHVSSSIKLASYEGLTVTMSFPKNVVAFLPPTKYVSFWETIFGKLTIAVIVLVATFWYILLPVIVVIKYFKHGRDPYVGPAVTAWYDPPETKGGRQLSPTETGSLIDEKVDVKDIFSAIIDLARRGYIKIKEDKKKKFTLIFTDKPSKKDSLLPFEKKLLDGIFEDTKEVELEDVKFYKTVREVEKMVYEDLEKEGFFPHNPKTVRTKYYALGAIALFTFNLVLGFLAFFLGRIMPRKTLYGAQQANVAKGLKNYLKLQERQLNYQGNKQLFFEKLLPFAVAFGVEKNWAKRFEKIDLKNPDWYQGPSTTHFVAAAFIINLNSTYSNFSSSSTPPSSSSSGFSSGGFSGGGGGGGGGGSW